MVGYARTVLFLVIGMIVGGAGCKAKSTTITSDTDADSPSTVPAFPAPTAAAPKGTVTLTIAYGSEKKTWFEEQVKAFADTSPRTASGKAIQVSAKAMGSGE